jgi:O-antigen ligase
LNSTNTNDITAGKYLNHKRRLVEHKAYLEIDQRFWISLILIVGCVVAVADGLTRPEMLIDAPEDTFTYQAIWGAWAFALLMLPLCLQYARAARTRIQEGILLWFILGMVTFAKDFSYIRLPGVPIFITDVLLVLFLMRLFIGPGRTRIRFDSIQTRLLLLYFGVGLITLLRSVLERHDMLLTFRDFAIAFYCLFAFVGYAVIRNWEGIRRVFFFFVLGAIFSCIDAFFWLLNHPGGRRYLSPGDYVLAAFLGILVATDRKVVGPVLGYSVAALLGIGVFLSNARTLYVELAFMLFLMAILRPGTWSKVRKIRLKALIIGSLVVAFGIGILAQTRVGSAFIDRSFEQLISGTVDYQDDPNAVFRLSAWAETLSLAAQHPLFGIGYGVILDPFTFELAKQGSAQQEYSVHTDTRPHNTYLTVLYQMGLAGLIALLCLLFQFFGSGWKTLRRSQHDATSMWLYLALMAQLVMCLYGGFNLFLETPFLASIFWLGIGVAWRILYLSQLSEKIYVAP